MKVVVVRLAVGESLSELEGPKRLGECIARERADYGSDELEIRRRDIKEGQLLRV